MTQPENQNSTKVPRNNKTLSSRQFSVPDVIIETDHALSLHDATHEAEYTATIQSYFRTLRSAEICASTALKYRNCLKAYVDWLGARLFSETTAKEFLGELREKGFSNSTVKFYYHSLRPFLLTQGITLKLRYKKTRKLPLYRSVDQVKAILAATENRTDKWSQVAGRDRLILAIFAYTGIRRGELLALRPRDIDFVNKSLRILGKGDKERIIPIHNILLKPLQDYIADIPPHHYLFPLKAGRVYRIVFNYARRAGIPNFHPHAFRHFFATQLVERGVPLHIIQKLLGHADISTTAVYLDIFPTHLTTAVAVLPDFTNERGEL